MSINSEESKEAVKVDDVCCASCGIAPVDDIKLKACCDGCDLVKYCSNKCRENHREQHEEECIKRKAELHDKDLFEQPEESHFGECPICFLPMPLDHEKSRFFTCCCKLMCTGCVYADYKSSGGDRCPFCREPVADSEEESYKRVMERAKVNDPNALRKVGAKCYNEGDFDKAIEYFKEAAELGDAAAHYHLGNRYCFGEGVEKDMEKAIRHWEEAAIDGHPVARHNLGCEEGDNKRAVKHFIIAAKLGHEESMKELWKHYSWGTISKEELEATLRTHKAAIDATKSAQRDTGEAFFRGISAS